MVNKAFGSLQASVNHKVTAFHQWAAQLSAALQPQPRPVLNPVRVSARPIRTRG